MAKTVHEALSESGAPMDVEGIGNPANAIIGWGSTPGTLLEALYAETQELHAKDGRLLASCRYVVFWWGRGDGKLDTVLCGAEPGRLDAAFEAGGLDPVRAEIEELSQGAMGVVVTPPLPGRVEGEPFVNSRYPFHWMLVPDKKAYLPGEKVTLALNVTNISVWPMPLDYLPPTVVFYSSGREVYVAPFVSGHRVLGPGESLNFVVEWDQAAAWGQEPPRGAYEAQARFANTASSWLPQGPAGDLTLLPKSE